MKLLSIQAMKGISSKQTIWAIGIVTMFLVCTIAMAKAQTAIGGHIGFVLPLVTRVGGQTTNLGDNFSMAGKSDTECTRECVRRGSQHALIVGEKTYILDGGPANELQEFAGTRVRVSGIIQGATIHVESVVAGPPGPSLPKQQHRLVLILSRGGRL